MFKKTLSSNFIGLSVVTVLAGFSGGAMWASAAHADNSTNFFEQPTLTGDWGGIRTNLQNEGISFYAQLQQQFGGVPSGGREQGFDYDQQFILGTKLDLQKLFGLNGAFIHLEVTDRAGRNAGSDLVGSKIEPLNDFGSGENFRLSNMSYEQNLFDQRVNILIGYYPDGNEFANSGAVLCAFLANGFCGHPNTLTVDSNGEQNAPGAQWGGRIKAYITPSLYDSVGLYDVNPTLTSPDDNGFKLGLVNSTGAIVFEELGKITSLGPDKLVGHYKIGGYYDTSTVPDIAHSNIAVTGRYGGYLLLDQMVYSFAPGTNRGLIVFGDMTINDKRTSLEGSYFDAGVIFRGAFTSRPNDTIALGWIRNNDNQRKLDAETIALEKTEGPGVQLFTAEQVFEADYNLLVGPWFSVHPTVQYWVDPGAVTFQHFNNALFFGMQTTVNF
jgi:porin